MDLFNSIYNNHFTENEISLIKNKHQRLNFKKNEIILKENCFMKDYYCLESGVIRTFVNDIDNNQITTNFFTKNEIVINLQSLFLNQPSLENIQTITDCICWKISYQDFLELFTQMEKFRDWGRLWMTKSYLDLNNRVISHHTKTAKERYLNILNNQTEVIHYTPLKFIASYLGMTDSTLSRIRREI